MEEALVIEEACEVSCAATMSKNKYKKMLKSQKWESQREERKAFKKAKAKEKKSMKQAARREAGIVEEYKKPEVELDPEEKLLRKEARRQQRVQQCEQNYAIVIDCAWEHIHNPGPLISLSQQIVYCHGLNRRSDFPCFIHLTGLSDTSVVRNQLVTKCHAAEWRGVTLHSEDYREVIKDRELVYLTSEAEETLTSLDNNCAYIIGGIVDRNKSKGVTYAKASQQGIRTAKLPIRENLQMAATHVLTVNHVFEIMQRFKEYNCWKEAIAKVLPQRKQAKPIENEGESNEVNSSVDDNCKHDNEDS